MSFDISCQTFTEVQAKINVKYKHILSMVIHIHVEAKTFAEYTLTASCINLCVKI